MEHQALLRAVETSDCTVFVEWYERVQTESNSAVKESVDRLSKKDLCEIWTIFTKWIAEITNLLKENPDSTENDSIMNNLLIMSTMATYTIQNMSNVEPQGLKPSLKAMNGSLKFVTCKKAATSICKMSELYWKVHPELETSLSINAIHWLLTQALHPKAMLVSVKHLWDMKQSIEKLNPLVLESSGLLALFLSGISNSKFISSNEGRKCIACLFSFGPVTVQTVQKTVKKFIPLASLADCESLGEIYFKAWRMASEENRADIEFSIQDLMYHAVVACRKPLGAIEGGVNKVPMNKLLFHLLHAIHRQRKQRTVAVLIHSLYKPILWRYLEASNGMVRGNALCLFFDAFPFESGEGFEEDEAVRNKQWAIMLGALMDPIPLIRTIAIQGTCQILSQYWEIIPVNIIQDFITCLMRKLLYDSSSAEVRAHVVKGLVLMLESKQTHSLLEKMIPLTNKVLHDPNEKVRSEYVFLLTHVQKLRVSKLWEVIDVNHLVARLEMDTSKNVCRRLTTLLAPFYCPKSTPEIVFQRCLRLVIDNRSASRKFYQYIDTCVGIEQMAQLILIIWKFLRNHIHKQLQRNKGSKPREETANQRRPKRSRQGESAERLPNSNGNEDKENQDGSTDSEEAPNEEFSEYNIVGLIDVVCILLSSNKTKFKAPQNLVYWENIKSRFTKTCSLFFRYFKNSDGLRPLICLYGLMSSNSSTLLLSFVKSQLKSLTDEATSKEFSHLVDVMCNWGRGEDLLDLISDHLQGNLMNFVSEKSPLSETRKGKATRKKQVSFETPKDNKPLLGLRCMAYILQHPYNKKIILRKNLEQLEKLCEALKAVLLIVENSPNQLTNRDSFLFGAASLYVKMVLVLACSYKRENSDLKYVDSQEKIVGILNWINRLMENEDLNQILGDLMASVIASISNLVMIHSMAWNVCREFLDVVLQVVRRYPSSRNLTLAMNCAYQSLVFVWSERSIGNECDVECESQINLLINCVLESPGLVGAVGSSKRSCLDEGDWFLVRDIVRKILEECHRHNPEKHKSIHEIVRKMADTIRLNMIQLHSFEQGDSEKKTDDVRLQHDIPHAIIAAFRTQNALAKMILEEFFEACQVNENGVALANFVAIARLLENLGQNKGRISPGTFANAILSCEDWWSNVGEIEKSANAGSVAYINATFADLKKAFSV